VDTKSPVLYEKLYNYVLEEIRSGALQPGDRVPSEKELADRFGVSRITSKRALETLERAGVIDRVRGKGSFVGRNLPPQVQLSSVPVEWRSGFARRRAGPAIGLVVPDVSEAYGLKLLIAAEERCAELGAHLIFRRTHGDPASEGRAVDLLAGSGLDGLIVFPVHGEYYNRSLVRLVLDGYPLVLVDRYLAGIEAPAVYTDNLAAGEALTGYLLDRGHRHIALLSPPPENTTSLEDRLRGFRSAYARRDLGRETQYYVTNLYSTLPDAFRTENIATDEETIQRFVDVNPSVTAFVACEYNLAMVLMDVLRGLGKRVPEDYSVACFDAREDPIGRQDVTHIRQDEAAMGRTAVDMVVSQLRGERPGRITVGFELIEGRSTSPRA
jgi:DNA-binding LacI/PurR family transcriptional regulator/biotin operon repressor